MKSWRRQEQLYLLFHIFNYDNLTLRQANQYNVPIPTTYITEVPFLRVKDTQEEILALEGGIDRVGRKVDEKSTYTTQ
jgi:hypothetical protein